jgi:tetratricopeptide (TPR) repeat protein
MKHIYLIIFSLLLFNSYLGFSEEENNIISKKCFEYNPKAIYNADLLSWRGIGFLITEHFFEAEQCFKEAIELNPDDFAAYHNLGLVYYRTCQFDDAIANFTKAINKEPLLAKAYLHRGLAYSIKYEQKQKEQYLTNAKTNYEIACELESIDACEILLYPFLKYILYPDPDNEINKIKI